MYAPTAHVYGQKMMSLSWLLQRLYSSLWFRSPYVCSLDRRKYRHTDYASRLVASLSEQRCNIFSILYSATFLCYFVFSIFLIIQRWCASRRVFYFSIFHLRIHFNLFDHDNRVQKTGKISFYTLFLWSIRLKCILLDQDNRIQEKSNISLYIPYSCGQ